MTAKRWPQSLDLQLQPGLSLPVVLLQAEGKIQA